MRRAPGTNPTERSADHGPTCTCREHPLPAAMRVRDALGFYLAENGFTTAGYDNPKTEGSILGFKVSVPNPPSHQNAIKLHDLHHVATGFGTDHAGEAEISAWQIRRGLGGTNLYVGSIVALNTLLGLVLAPRRTVVALRAEKHGGSLFSTSLDYEALLDKTVGELREILQLPPHGLARMPRGLHAGSPQSGSQSR